MPCVDLLWRQVFSVLFCWLTGHQLVAIMNMIKADKFNDSLLPTILRDRLRSDTRKAHKDLEDALDLLHQPSSREYFIHLLVRFHGFHSVWESAIGRQLPDTVKPRSRLLLIEHDLRALGLDETGIRSITPCAQAARLGDNADAALGSVYVLEGSTLGGLVITRQLSKASWWPPEGLRYFNPYGDNTGSNWQTMLRHLSDTHGDHDRIVAGALFTFEILQDWLVGQSPSAHNQTVIK